MDKVSHKLSLVSIFFFLTSRAPKIPKVMDPPVSLLDTEFENPSEAVAEKLAELEKKLADGNYDIDALFL